MPTQDTEPLMDVKTFRAKSMRDALRIVKESLGPEAVILHTRQIPGKRLLPWQTAPDEVEITAGIGINVPSHVYPAKTSSVPKNRVGNSVINPSQQELPAHLMLDKDSGVRLELSQSAPGFSKSFEPTIRPEPILAVPPVVQSGRSSEPSVAELAKQIESIQQMLVQLGLKTNSQPEAAPAEELPPALQNMKEQLLEKDVAAGIAQELLTQLKTDCTPSQLDDELATKAMLTALIQKRIATNGPIKLEPGQRKVVALVGATGVGKTTTIAKLAANFRLRDQIKMGLVTVDTYRIAAVEQLRTYAEIIDLPMKVVTNPLEMRRALDELTGLDLVLIDTAGRSPRDDLQIQELKRLLVEAKVDEVHLVLSLTASFRSLLASAEKFASANATSIILTKLDEATGLGSLLSLCQQVPLPISYLTTGQDVPNDIEPARPDRMARLILGSDQVPN